MHMLSPKTKEIYFSGTFFGQPCANSTNKYVVSKTLRKVEAISIKNSNSLFMAREMVVQPMASGKKPPPIMPAVIAPGGPTDIMTAFYKNRVIFIGSNINSQLAQKVISQLLALEAIDPKSDIKMYINSPGGSPYNAFAIYDCMATIKPDVSTVAFGMVASQATLLLAGGAKGKRFAMPNTRIMIHQPQGGTGGRREDVQLQLEESLLVRDKVDEMYSAFCNLPKKEIWKYTDRDTFLSAAAAMDLGLVDALLETEY